MKRGFAGRKSLGRRLSDSSCDAIKTFMKYVYLFLPDRVDGHKGLASLLGNKGAHLAEMSQMGLPIPPGFTISTEAFRSLQRTGELPPSLQSEVKTALEMLGHELGLEFGGTERPLLVSVRSGAPVSMPGMMSTVCNIGLTRETLNGLISSTNNPRFAYDTFRRLIETYVNLVMEQTRPRKNGSGQGITAALADYLNKIVEQRDEDEDNLPYEQLARICDEYLLIIKNIAHRRFPESADEQLWEAINAVFQSWHNKHAVAYRERMGISHEIGTAVTVQAMVFGNLGDSSGAGVLFTRDPVTGEHAVSGEWLPNAQGEDVVDGIITPYPLRVGSGSDMNERSHILEGLLPGAFARLLELAKLLEAHYREVQEIEFIIQERRLWVLQSRSSMLSRLAVIRTAVDMVREELITIDEGLKRTERIPLNDVYRILDPGVTSTATPIAKGIPASVGVASGIIALTADRAEQFEQEGKSAIFISDYIEPSDIHGIDAAAGLVTNRGGMASHLAVTARGWNKVCVVGCGTLKIDSERRSLSAEGSEFREGDDVTVDGSSGFIYQGRLAHRNGFNDYISTTQGWRRKYDPLKNLKVEGFD